MPRARTHLAVFMAVALVGTPAAGAHVVPTPPGIPVGARHTVSLDVPNERTVMLIRVDVSFDPGLTLVSATDRGRWRASVSGATVTWTGGEIAPAASEPFAVVLQGDAAGAASFTAILGYADDEEVTWQVPLTILPATADGSGSQLGTALVVGAVGVSLILGTLLARHWRRSSLHDR